ncbi:interferon-induced protein 44-like [Scomber scombrus]
MLYGSVGAGKSSFISSVSSCMRGRMGIPAAGNATTGGVTSFTTKYETHRIKKGDRGDFYPFVFNDIMGLEENDGRGVRVDDIKLVLQGHVFDKYKKMKEIREAARDLGIPQVAIVTKIDEACKETKKDLKNVYKSKYLKKKMTDFSSQLGIPLNCIFPVKSYSSEISLVDDVDSLILSALRRMIDFGDDFINTM